jgi:hypothetical protein
VAREEDAREKHGEQRLDHELSFFVEKSSVPCVTRREARCPRQRRN